MRRARVYCNGQPAGTLIETPGGFEFAYDAQYLAWDAPPVSLTLPRRTTPYQTTHLFPYFYGLLAEGSTRALQQQVLRIDENDHFGLLLATGGDPVGSVSIKAL